MRAVFRFIILVIIFLASDVKGQSLGFLPNKGQVYDQDGKANKSVKFLYRDGPLQFQLRDKGFSYEIFRKNAGTENNWDITRLDLSMKYVGSSEPLQFDWQGENELEDVSHYYNHLGRFENLKRARKVTGTSKDKNVKLVFEVSADGKVKYDIWVKPSVAQMIRIGGHEQSRLLASDRPDKVSFIFFDDTIMENIPKVALMRKGAEEVVANAGWAQAENEQTLKIVLPEGTSWRDADWVVIDPLPTLRWATYYGGSSNDQGYGTASCQDGNVVFCGKTASNSNIASSGAHKNFASGSDDAFLVKMKRSGGSTQRVWGTYFGGKDGDVANDVSTDKFNNIIIAGTTSSTGLGFKANYDSTHNGSKDVFIAKFTDSGKLVWSNYLGGASDDEGLGVVLDSSQNVVVVGKTGSSGLSSRLNPSSYTIHQASISLNGDGLIGKFDKDGKRLFITYYGGTNADEIKGIHTGAKDTIVVVGTTSSSTGIATTGSFSRRSDAFIAKFDANGLRILSKYFGDTADDYGYNVKYKNGSYFMVGKTNSDAGIAKNGHQSKLNAISTYSSSTDGFLVKFDARFNILWGTYYGGDLKDDAMSLEIDDFDYIYICGTAESDNSTTGYNNIIATADAQSIYNSGGSDAYVAKFSSAGKRIWGTYFGGTSNELGSDLSHGRFGDVYFVGETSSSRNIVVNAYQSSYGTATDAYFADLYYCKKFAILRKDTVCLNDTFSIKFTDSAHKNNWNLTFKKYKFLWTGPNNFMAAGNKPFALQTARRKALWKDTGIYQLIVTDSFGCKDTAKIRVNYFYPLPVDSFKSAKDYCKWDTLKFKATAGPWGISNYQFYWRSIDNVFKSGDNKDTLRYPALKGKSDGKYILRIKDHLGCTTLDTFNVNVGPTAQLTSNSPICPKDTIELAAKGIRLKKVVWKGPNNYLDSGISVKILNADKAKMGKYTAIVTDSSGCKDTFYITTVLFQLDSLTITRNDPICSGDELKISASMRSLTSKFGFTWSGPNSFSTTNRTFSITGATAVNAGSYKLEITENVSKCKIDTSLLVTIRPLPYPHIQTNAPVCEGNKFTIRSYPKGGAGSGYRFTWTTPKNTTSTDTGLIINPVTRADSGLYRLKLQDVYGCTKDTSVVFALKMLPDVNFTPNRDSQCSKNSTFTFTNRTILTSGSFNAFTWKTQGYADTVLTNKNAISRKYTSVGKYKVTLIAKSNDGCIDSLTKYVGVYPEPTLAWDIVSSDTQCLKRNSFEFDDKSTISKGTLTRYWTFGDGGKSSADPAKYSYTTAGDFTVKLKVMSGFGCSDSSTKKVRVNDNPKAAISVNNSTQCLNGNRFIFTDISTISAGWKLNGRKWNLGSGFADTTKKDTTSFGSAGNYTVSLAVISADGCTDTAKTIVTVQSTPTAGAIASDQTICNGGNPVAFTSTTAGSGSGTITYRWESSTNSGGTWSPVSGATGATYDVPAGLTTTTQYRRITISTQNSVPCESVATTPVTVNVQSAVTAGVIASSQTICNGGDPVAFTSTTAGSGSGTITYRWESSTNGTTWTTISGATSDVYDVPAGLTTTTQYRRITISTLNGVPCQSGAASPVTVTVQNRVTAGTIGSSQTICEGGNPAAFTSTTSGTGSGTITYRWEASTNSGATWSPIAGATTSTYDVPAGLTTSTQYRRITIATLNGVPCESVATGIVTVTVQSAVTAGAIGSDQTICNGGNPVAFTSITAGSGSGAIAYRWEASTNSGASWTTVTGATGATYDVPAGLTTTTQYRRIAISTLNGVPCESVATTPVTVTVQSAVTAGAIGSSQTICNGGDPVAFTSTTAGNGSGTITYRWESSTNGGATWTTVSGATADIYDVPAGLTTTTLYRRVTISTLNSVPCESATTAITVTVQSTVTAGAIGSDQTICYGGNPVAFTSTTNGSGSGTITYRWESSTNGGSTWTTVTGATAATYDVPAGLTTTTQYRRITISTQNSVACESGATSTVTVTVQGSATAGAIGSDQTICNGGNPAAFTNLTLGSGSGTITYRWESSTNGGTTWSSISGATDTIYDVPAGLTTTTRYRRITISTLNSIPCETPTSAVIVTVQSTVTAGAISSNQTICDGGNPAAFTSTTNGTGSGTITYRWEASTNGGSTWTTITGATAATYDVPAGLTTTTQYRRITISTLNSVACESTGTSSITVTVQTVPTIGAISSDQTICNGGDPVAFTSTTNGSGSGTITYRWEASTNGGATWTTITGATAATYDVPAGLTTTTQYRRITISTQNSVACESGATSAITVTVQSAVTAGAIGSNQTICNGGDPVAFTSTTAGSGSGTITYRWESSTNGGATWTTVSGATADIYDVPAGLTTTTLYRRITVSTVNAVTCESVSTAAVTVTVRNSPTAGVIASDQTICNGGDPAAFTSTTAGTGDGTITYRWESSTNAGATWSVISGVTGSTYDVPAGLTVTSQYRRITLSTLSSLTCESNASKALTVTVQGVPTAGAVGSDQTICSGDDPVAFTNTASGTGDGTISYRWESSTNGGLTWSTITGATSATYDVPAGLTATSQYRRITLSTLNSVVCEATATSAINIKVNPLPTATAFSNSPVCTKGKLSLRSNGGNTYEWFGPNGYTSKQQNNIIYNVDSNYLGDYTVWVTDVNKCKDDFTIKVDIKPGFRVTAKTNSPVCTYDTLKLFGDINSYSKSTYSYEWVAKSFYSTKQNPVIDQVDSSRDGTYRFIAISANGCTDTAMVTPTILRPPLIKFVTNSPECVGQKAVLFNAFKSSISSTWRKPNGTTIIADTVKIPSLKLSDDGYYRLTIKDKRGCRNQDSIKYKVNTLPEISVTGDSQLCTGSTMKLSVTGTGTLNYKWTGPNGFISFLSKPTKTGVTMPDSGLYMVIGTDANQCRDTAKWNVKINPAIPGLKIYGDSQVCLWEKLTLSTIANTKNFRYKWRTPNNEVYYTAKLVIPLNKYSYEGVYSVTVSDSNYYCKDSTTDYVWVGPRPMSSSSNSPICAGDSLKLNAYGNSRWKWQWTGPQGFSSTSTNPKLSYVSALYAGNYTLIGKDTLGCSDTLTENVKINDCLVIELFSDSVKCKGNSSGLARVVAKGGSGSYQYKWLTSPVRFDDTLRNVPKGTYTVVVTDLKTGIVRIDSIKVNEPAAALSTSITIDSLICRDSSNAKLICKVTGGTAPYYYKWNGNSLLNGSTLLKVGSGTHSVVITDSRGCSETSSVVVVNPKRWTIGISRTNVLCAGGNTGSALVIVSGGKPAYFYQWDTVTWASKSKAIGSTYKNLKTGIYKVLITDANKCQQTDTVMIAQPDSLKVSFKIDSYIRCFGDTSGQITATAKGGVSSYTYLWNFNKKYTDKTAKNITAGWYVLQLRDGNNCLKKDSIFLAQPDDIKTKISILSHLKCYKDKSGAAEVDIKGGVAPYYVKWDNGGYTAQGVSKNYMDAGTHWVYVRDFQGCYDTLKLTLNQPDSIYTLFKSRQNILCYNGNSGWAEFELAGGTAPFKYLWENGDSTKRSVKLQATSYWMRAQDANGCKYSDTIQLTQPPELDVFVKKMDSVTCYGLSDGRIELSAVGGKQPCGFWFYTGKDTVKGAVLSGVSARQFPAKYDGYVRDANGCIDYTPVYIKEPAKLQVVRNGQTDLICYGASTASIFVGPAGGNGGYTYSWNSFPKQYASTAVKLKSGTYIVTLKDYKGCKAFDTFIIKQPTKNPVITKSIVPFCLNNTISLTAYQYGVDSVWWFNPAGNKISSSYPVYTKTPAIFNDSGRYTLLAKDKQGCYDTTYTRLVINKLPNVIASIQENPPHCKSDTVMLKAVGAVNYQWNGPNGFISFIQNPIINGISFPMDGWYHVLGTDANTCQWRDSVRLNIENNINIGNDQMICAGANLVLSGFGAEKYRWSGPHKFSSTLQSPILINVDDSMSGKFTLYAIDKYGCKDTLNTLVLIYPRPFIKASAIVPVCAGEPLNLFSKGGGNYKYIWKGPQGFTSTLANPVLMTSISTQSGKYVLNASYQADANNQCKDSASVNARIFDLPVSKFMLTPYSSIYLTEQDYELIDFSKNANTWTYYLNDQYLSAGPKAKFGQTEAGILKIKQTVSSPDFSAFSGKYCSDSSQQVFVIEFKPKIWLPNAFTPNNNNKNDQFYPVGVNITEYRLRIFDRWGNKIFDELNGKWSGLNNNGKPYPVGVYAVYVTYKDITGLERELKDNVTLLR